MSDRAPQSFVDRLEGRLAELRASGRFVVEHARGRPLPPEVVDRFARGIAAHEGVPGFRIDGGLRALWTAADGLRFQWRLADDDELVGSASLTSLSELYYPEALADDEGFSFRGDDRLFDWIGDDWLVAARLEGPGLEPTLWYQDRKGASYRLSLDVGAYLETMLRVRALRRWQAFFVDDPRFELDRDSAWSFVCTLERLFPDEDPRPFRARMRR